MATDLRSLRIGASLKSYVEGLTKAMATPAAAASARMQAAQEAVAG
jgi:hypothetical protein